MTRLGDDVVFPSDEVLAARAADLAADWPNLMEAWRYGIAVLREEPRLGRLMAATGSEGRRANRLARLLQDPRFDEMEGETEDDRTTAQAIAVTVAIEADESGAFEDDPEAETLLWAIAMRGAQFDFIRSRETNERR